MADLLLYHKIHCPFCQKVRTYLADKNIEIPMKEVDEDPENKKRLVEIGGMSQVPCLIVDGKALYESDDIITWFEENWKD